MDIEVRNWRDVQHRLHPIVRDFLEEAHHVAPDTGQIYTDAAGWLKLSAYVRDPALADDGLPWETVVPAILGEVGAMHLRDYMAARRRVPSADNILAGALLETDDRLDDTDVIDLTPRLLAALQARFQQVRLTAGAEYKTSPAFAQWQRDAMTVLRTMARVASLELQAYVVQRFLAAFPDGRLLFSNPAHAADMEVVRPALRMLELLA